METNYTLEYLYFIDLSQRHVFMYANKLGKKIWRQSSIVREESYWGILQSFLFMKRLFYLERQLRLIRILEVWIWISKPKSTHGLTSLDTALLFALENNVIRILTIFFWILNFILELDIFFSSLFLQNISSI